MCMEDYSNNSIEILIFSINGPVEWSTSCSAKEVKILY